MDISELENRRLLAQLQARRARALMDNGLVDTESGAPLSVRQAVGAAPDMESRIATIRKFYPDAVSVPDHPDNFIFNNTETGKPTLYNPRGLDKGDIASVSTREGAGMIGAGVGTGIGVTLGTPAGPPGMAFGGALGGGIGMALGEEVGTALSRIFSRTQDVRTPIRAALDFETSAALGTAGQGLLSKAGEGIREGAKRIFRGGEEGRQNIQQALADFAAGGTTPTVGQATSKRALDSIEGILAKAPGAAGVFANKVTEVTNAIDRVITQRADFLARRAAPEDVGRVVERGLTGTGGFRERFLFNADALYKNLDEFIKPDTPVTAENTISALKSIAGGIPGAPATSATRLISNPLAKELLAGLQSDVGSNSGSIPFAALQGVRSRVGALISGSGIINDIPKAQLKSIYAALSRDMATAAKEAGPEAENALSRASNFYRAGVKRIDDVIDPLLKKGDPEKIFKALAVGGTEGATTIRAVRRSLNENEWHVVSSGVLRRMGRATPGQQDATGEAFSVGTFLTNWNKLSPEAKDAFFNGNVFGDLRQNLDSIARAASRMRENSRAFANPSGTAGAVSGQSLALVGAGGLITGNIQLPLALAAGALGANRAARLMTNPNFVRWLAQATKIEPSGLGAYIGRLSAIAAGADSETQQDIRDYVSALGSAGR